MLSWLLLSCFVQVLVGIPAEGFVSEGGVIPQYRDGWMGVLSWLSGGGGMRNREFLLKFCGALGWCT